MKTDLYIPVSLSPPTFWIAFSSTIVSLKLLIASSDGLLNKLDTLNLTPSSDVSALVLLSASAFTSPPSKNCSTGLFCNLSIFLFGSFVLVSSSIPSALLAASCSWSSLCCSGSIPSSCRSFNNLSALSADLSATSSLSISALCTCLSSRVVLGQCLLWSIF